MIEQKLTKAIEKIRAECKEIADDPKAEASMKDFARHYLQGAEALYIATTQPTHNQHTT